jgi:hypothetical protein
MSREAKRRGAMCSGTELCAVKRRLAWRRHTVAGALVKC